MAANPLFPAEARDSVRRALAEIPSVDGVLLDEDGAGVWLLCDPTADRAEIEAEGRRRMDALGVESERVGIEFVVRLSRVPQQRVRLVNVVRTVQHDGRVKIEVELEWRGEHFFGEAEDAGAEPIELRSAATAALRALRAAAAEPLDVRIVGVKGVRAFDVDLVVVSVVRGSAPSRSLVGAVAVSGDPARAAAASLLQALNRVLGNYLEVTDR